MTRSTRWLLVLLLLLSASDIGCATVGKPGDSYPRLRDPQEEDAAHLYSD
jgi:hypothetical protein